MAELTFKSAGVSTREIDLSGPTPTGPQGVPAGIIGTAIAGPAFVPITFATFSEFNSIFGGADGEKFGPIAVNEWLKNARACTYLRVLGVGDGKKRDTTTGQVNNAGFVIGDEVVQDNGRVGPNASSNSTSNGIKGRTYFLGAFHSESNGSTIFSDAGIQQANSKASAIDCLKFGTAGGTNKPANNDDFNITIPSKVGGLGSPIQVRIVAGLGVPGPDEVFVLTDTNVDTVTQRFRAAFNGTGDAAYNALHQAWGSNVTGGAVGIQGVTAELGSDASLLTLTVDEFGPFGNQVNALADDTGTIVASAGSSPTSLAGGAGHAVPILRGVVLAPSGVILHLSGTRGIDAKTLFNAPEVGATARASMNDLMGRQGSLTGSVDVASQEFVMLMNGFKGDASKKTVITASFDMTAPNYFANVFNTDPLRIEEKGHYLYSHYDIYPTMANVTGSGVFGISHACEKGKIDVAFLLTSSMGREAASISDDANFVSRVSYEDFQDRFNAPSSPFIISQEFDRPLDLFKVESINDGQGDATAIKISIENIKRRTSDVDKFGTFDLLVRDFKDTDDEKKVLESFRGLSLDPGSDRYVARSIGDQKIFFNFDNDTESQKIVVDGTHPVRSRFVRVVLSDAMKKKEVPDEALPMGFRGPQHLLTSGSLLSSETDSEFLPGNLLSRVVEPPVPYRENIAIGLSVKKRADARFFWGMQTARKTDPAQPNKVSLIDESWRSFNKHFPNRRKDNMSFSVSNNPGVADINGTVLDCDKFNKNQFSLEKIQVVTGSDGFADSDSWKSAVYVRAGNIAANEVNKTRKFKIEDLDRVANRKYAKFTLPVQGGFDGTNIFNKSKSKLENVAAKREMDQDLIQGGTSGPTVSAYRKAVDIMGSKSDTEIQLLAIPGIRHPSVTDFAINAVESRFDALYIMDIEERDQFNTVVTSSVQKPHVLNTVNDLKNRALDTSFAATYFPDLTITDPKTQALVQVPPSVAVLGAYSLNDSIGHPWFAPAGFTRGSLNAIESTSVKLNRTNLDDLYDSDINPITSFPGTGITVWGQKTLLQRASALDRINVRRLLISVRRSVRNIANSLLFEPNRAETLEKFSSLVNPILQRVQELSGVDRYKVIIDTTTTTQADVENNTIRGKIFLQPTRTVEFVALDFVVTNAGSELL